jgi:hypothetical protein
MRGEALGNKEYQEIRRGNLVTGSVMLLLRRTLYWSCGLFISRSVTVIQKETHSHSVVDVTSLRCICSQFEEKWIYEFLRENTVLISVRCDPVEAQEALAVEARPTVALNAVELSSKTILKESCELIGSSNKAPVTSRVAPPGLYKTH